MPKQDITPGILVHYMQDNGSHSAAIITSVSVSNEEENIVNLFIMRDDKIFETYHAHNVKYSEGLEPRTWHYIEGHKTWKKGEPNGTKTENK